MAETLRAELQLDISGLTSALQRAGQEVQAFAQRVQQQMSQVTQALSQHTQATQQTTTANNALTQAMTQLNNTARTQLTTLQQMSTQMTSAASATHQAAQATSAWATAWSVAAGLGIATTIGGIISMLKDAATESVNLAVRFQSLQAGFTAVSGGALAAARDLAFVRTESTRMGTEFFTTAKSFRDFSAATRGTALEGEKTRQIFQTLTETSRVLGLSAAESHRLFVAFEQIMSKGKVSAEELRRQLGNVLPGAFEVAARSIGKTTSELDEMLRAGKLLSEDFLPKFVAQLQREFGGGVEQAMTSAAASFQRLGNEIQALGIEIGNSLLKALQPITDFVAENLRELRRQRETLQDIRTQEVTGRAKAAGIDVERLSKPQLDKLLELYSTQVTLEAAGQGNTLENYLTRTVSQLAARNREAVEAAKAAVDAMYEQIYAQQTVNKLKQEQSDIESKITMAENDAVTALKKISEILGQINNRPGLGSDERFGFVSSRYDALIQGAATQSGIDPGLFSRLIQQESGFHPSVVSKAGAVGLGQIMPSTAAAYGVQHDDLFDVQKNIELSARIFGDLAKKYQEFDDATRFALAAYNAGEPKIDKAIQQVRQAGLSPSFQNIAGLLPKETQKYVPAIYGTGMPVEMAQAMGVKDLTAEYNAQIKALKDIENLLSQTPGLSARLTPELREQLKILSEQTIETKERLEQTRKEPAEAAHAAHAIEMIQKRLENQREQARLAIERFAAGQETEDQKREKAIQEEQKWMKLFAEDQEMQVKIRQATANRLQEIEDDLADKRRDAIDKVQKHLEQQQTAALAKIQQFAAGPETFDQQREKARQDQEKWLLLFQGNEEVVTQIHQGTTNRLLAIDEKWREEQERELKKALQPWKELAEGIHQTLAGVFEQALLGTLDFWETVKRLFLRSIADLAAQALTYRIIIPAAIQLLGGSGLGGMGYGGTASAANGAMGPQALGYAQQAGQIANMGMGGGNPFGMYLGQNQVMANLMNTPLITWGGGPTGSALQLQGPLMANGQFFSGGGVSSFTALEGGYAPVGAYATGVDAAGVTAAQGVTTPAALSGLTVGSAIGAVGAGVGTGMLLSQFNSEVLGLSGIGGSTLAGAGGGALAGTMIMPGIGTAIGAIVGAIGGALAGWLGGGPPEPGFEIKQTQAGQLRYDETLGLTVVQDFAVLKDFHQRLGVKYESFIGDVNESINMNFTHIVDQIKHFSPEVQKALIDPMNSAFADISGQISGTARVGGDDMKEELQKLLGETIPDIFKEAATGVLKRLQDAAQKVDPVIKSFNDVIAVLQRDLDALRAQQLQMQQVLQGGIVSLQSALLTPEQRYGQMQGQYQQLLGQFGQGSPQEQILLAPRLAQASNALLRMAQQQMHDPTGILDQLSALSEGVQTVGYTAGQRRQLLQNQYNALQQHFTQATYQERLALAPRLTATANQLLGMQEQPLDATGVLDQFSAGRVAIQQDLYSPAQSYLALQQQYSALKSQFGSASAAQRIQLAPQLAQTAQGLLRAAKSDEVLGQDPQLVRNLQQSLYADMNTFYGQVQEAVSNANAAILQSNEAMRQTIYDTNMANWNAITQGNYEQQKSLESLQQTLIQDLTMVQTQTDEAFAQLQGPLQEQVQLAQQQVDLLKGSLANLDSVNGVVQASLDVLRGMLDRLGGRAADTLDPLTQAQVVLLGGMSQIGTDQLTVLREISAKLGTVPQYAEGSDYIPRSGLAFLHRGEAVIRRQDNIGGQATITVRVEGETPAGIALSQQLVDAVATRIERNARLGKTAIMVRR